MALDRTRSPFLPYVTGLAATVAITGSFLCLSAPANAADDDTYTVIIAEPVTTGAVNQQASEAATGLAALGGALLFSATAITGGALVRKRFDRVAV